MFPVSFLGIINIDQLTLSCVLEFELSYCGPSKKAPFITVKRIQGNLSWGFENLFGYLVSNRVPRCWLVGWFICWVVSLFIILGLNDWILFFKYYNHRWIACSPIYEVCPSSHPTAGGGFSNNETTHRAAGRSETYRGRLVGCGSVGFVICLPRCFVSILHHLGLEHSTTVP